MWGRCLQGPLGGIQRCRLASTCCRGYALPAQTRSGCRPSVPRRLLPAAHSPSPSPDLGGLRDLRGLKAPAATPRARQSGLTPSVPRRFLRLAHSLLTQDCTCGIVQHVVAGRRHYVVSPSLEPALHHRADFSIVEVAEARARAWHSRRERPSTKVGR